jgi:hypothetical protein
MQQYRRAADQGIAKATYNLGRMYEEGRGVPQDHTEALQWYRRAADQVRPRTTGHHAHNIYLHSWYELGAIGALLLAVAGTTVIMLIFLLPASAQPFAGGAFAAFALIGAFAWGMWQSWFMCAIGLVPLYLRVATAAVQTASGGLPADDGDARKDDQQDPEAEQI